jgi:cardiolipin synthase
MARVLAAVIDGARERLWITTPYFAPPRRAVRRLVAAAQRGVEVRLLLPGARTDVPIVRHAAHGTYARLLRGGVRIFEYQRAVLHAKTLVADGHAALVGSSNLDIRSLRHNAECNVLLFHDGWGAALAADMTNDLEGSEEVTPAAWQRRGRWHRLVDRVAYAMRWAW